MLHNISTLRLIPIIHRLTLTVRKCRTLSFYGSWLYCTHRITRVQLIFRKTIETPGLPVKWQIGASLISIIPSNVCAQSTSKMVCRTNRLFAPSYIRVTIRHMPIRPVDTSRANMNIGLSCPINGRDKSARSRPSIRRRPS